MQCMRLAVLVVGTLFAALVASPAIALTAASFGPAANVDTGDGPASVAVGDFNGDGNPDLAVANQLASTVSVLLGSAGGSTAKPPTSLSAASPRQSQWPTSTATRIPT